MRPRFLVLLLISTAVFGQAYVPEQGTTTLSLGYQHSHIDNHVMADGTKVPNLDVRSNSLTLGIDYSLTDRLALGVSLPYVSSRYKGLNPHPGIIDNGDIHGMTQDLRIDLRYMALEGPIVLSPMVAWTQPSHDYEAMGHAAAGKGLQELAVGFAAAGAPTVLPGLFVSGGSTYTFVEKVDPEFNVDRLNAELSVGYVVTPRLFARISGAWQNTRDGLLLPFTEHALEHHFHEHDQLLKSNHIRGGAGLSFAITPGVDVYVSYAAVLSAENSHSGDSIGIGTSFNFMPRAMLANRRAGRIAADQLRKRDSAF
jgi:hypothetical protein